MALTVCAAQTVHALSVKADPLATRGCIPKVSVAEAKKIVDQYNYKLIGATPMETRSIGTSLTFIERLNGGKTFTPAVAREGYGVRFREKKGHSAQRSGEIAINRNGDLKYGENVAQLTHEIGHLVGNNGLYEEYRTALGHTRRHPKYCKVSGYSTSRANEQFAEAFAAFVTRPELIKDSKDPNCKKAWAFFKKKFPGHALADKCYVAQNEVESKLEGIADGVPSEPGVQTRESKERGIVASQADGKAKPVARSVYKPTAKPVAPAAKAAVVAAKPSVKAVVVSKAEAKTPPKAEATKPTVATEKKVEPKTATAKPAAKPAVKPEAKPAAKPAVKPEVKPAPKAEAPKPEPKATPKPAATPKPKPTATPRKPEPPPKESPTPEPTATRGSKPGPKVASKT